MNRSVESVTKKKARNLIPEKFVHWEVDQDVKEILEVAERNRATSTERRSLEEGPFDSAKVGI